MKYCETGIKGGCNIEFLKGCLYPIGTKWHPTSLFVDYDVFGELDAFWLFASVLDRFDTCGINKVTYEDWQKIKRLVPCYDQNIQLFVQEIDDWAQKCFLDDDCFYILGV